MLSHNTAVTHWQTEVIHRTSVSTFTLSPSHQRANSLYPSCHQKPGVIFHPSVSYTPVQLVSKLFNPQNISKIWSLLSPSPYHCPSQSLLSGSLQEASSWAPASSHALAQFFQGNERILLKCGFNHVPSLQNSSETTVTVSSRRSLDLPTHRCSDIMTTFPVGYPPAPATTGLLVIPGGHWAFSHLEPHPLLPCSCGQLSRKLTVPPSRNYSQMTLLNLAYLDHPI